jgi:hypothetical protein
MQTEGVKGWFGSAVFSEGNPARLDDADLLRDRQ